MNEELILNVVSDVVSRLTRTDAAKHDFNVIMCVSDLVALRDSLLLSAKYKVTPKVK